MSAYGVDRKHHILSVLVENKAGVLARVAGLFSRRGYNIFSLAVAPSDDERLSRITIVVDVESAPLEQIVKQLDKLIPVVAITELDPAFSRERELLLATVEVDTETRGQVIQLVGVFEGKIVDVGFDRLTIMMAGAPSKVDDFEELIRVYGIVELQRTGRVALPMLDRSEGRSTSTVGGRALGLATSQYPRSQQTASDNTASDTTPSDHTSDNTASDHTEKAG